VEEEEYWPAWSDYNEDMWVDEDNHFHAWGEAPEAMQRDAEQRAEEQELLELGLPPEDEWSDRGREIARAEEDRCPTLLYLDGFMNDSDIEEEIGHNCTVTREIPS
jgi:hypothetical protein